MVKCGHYVRLKFFRQWLMNKRNVHFLLIAMNFFSFFSSFLLSLSNWQSDNILRRRRKITDWLNHISLRVCVCVWNENCFVLFIEFSSLIELTKVRKEKKRFLHAYRLLYTVLQFKRRWKSTCRFYSKHLQITTCKHYLFIYSVVYSFAFHLCVWWMGVCVCAGGILNGNKYYVGYSTAMNHFRFLLHREHRHTLKYWIHWRSSIFILIV